MAESENAFAHQQPHIGIRAARSTIDKWARLPRKSIAFDFNGTLSDDEPIVFAVYAELFEEHLGWTLTQDYYRRKLFGFSDTEMIRRAIARKQTCGTHEVEQLNRARGDRYRRAVERVATISKATIVMLRRLADHGVPMAIVTGAQHEDVEAVLNRAGGVRELFTAVITERDVHRGKPDPEGYLLAAKALGCAAGEVLVFEDSPPGVRAACLAGMPCIAVTPDLANIPDGACGAVRALDMSIFDTRAV